MSKCCVTGAKGYVGSRLAEALRSAGSEVVELSRSGHSPVVLGQEVPGSVFEGADILLHCAYDFSLLTWQDIKRVNVDGSIALINAAIAAGIKRVVFISSISAYDGCYSLYGRAKLEVEKFVLSKGGAVIRPGLVYGDSSGGMVGSLTGVIERSKVVPVVGASQLMYLCHEQDLAKLVLSLVDLSKPVPSEAIIAASEVPWKFVDILRAIASKMKRNPFFVPLPWPLVWLGIKSAETLGLKLGFRSDSLLSLAYPNPNPRFELANKYASGFRAFN